jgi:hypothetical protein
MLRVGSIVGGNGIGSRCSTILPKPCEGDFLFSSLLVGQSPLQGHAPFGASFLSAKWCDPTVRSAVSPQGRGAMSMMASGRQAIRLLHISCVGTSSVVTSLSISSIVTSPVGMDSSGCPRPTSSLAIAMPAVLGAIPSLHPRHKNQRLLFFFQHYLCDFTAGTVTRQQQGQLIPALAFRHR